MFDNLRNDASLFDDGPTFEPELLPSQPSRRAKRQRPGRFLGMTPVQRFILTVMLMVAVCSLGTLVMLVSGKFWLG
ncbi:MAG: hypothetical protein Fur0043_06520 [Anaerolineales bacterium]